MIDMVFVKVRETFDLHTVRNKMTVIGVHTPKADLIKKNFPGLLVQCKAYRPVSCDVAVACASMLPADPLQVSTTEGDIAPEDLFNPILYKATTNLGLSQIEARIQALGYGVSSAGTASANGQTAVATNTGVSNTDADFDIYYGLLADSHGWKHANPQSGFVMSALKPLVYEMLYSVGDNYADAMAGATAPDVRFTFPDASSAMQKSGVAAFKGHAKAMPFINCTAYSTESAAVGFPDTETNEFPYNHSTSVPAPKVFCGIIIVPPSRLHELYYRMVVTWTLEFSGIRSVGEIGSWDSLATIGQATHLMDYDFSSSKSALGLTDTQVDTNDAGTVSANVDVDKVM